MGQMKNSYNTLVRKPGGKRPRGRPRHGWEDNTRMGIRERGWEVVDWIHLAHDRNQWQVVVNTVINFSVP
jgi:hypothetical protein